MVAVWTRREFDFFFQAEDGIRDPLVTGVQTCALPIWMIAFAAPDVPWHGPEWHEHEHEVARWCRLLEESGVPADPSRLDLPPPPPAGPRGATVIHPGAASGARRWPTGRWA